MNIRRSWLAKLIGAMDITQKEFAELMNVSETLVSYWISGQRDYTLDHAIAMTQIFEKPLDEFWIDGKARQ